MRANQIFAAMPQEQATEFFKKVAEKSPVTFQQAMAAACGALKIRPVYLRKQTFEKRATYVRRVLMKPASKQGTRRSRWQRWFSRA